MITVFFLLSWTEAGIEAIKDSPKRYEDAVKLLEGMGGKSKGVWLVTGDYDLVMLAEIPSDALPKFVLSVARQGMVRSKTIRAWPEAEYRDIIGSL